MEKPYKIAFTCGVFDMLHAGHINLLTAMHEKADNIVVILHDDKSTFFNKNKFPVQNSVHRATNLKLSGLTENVFMVEESDPSVRFSEILSILVRDSNEAIFMRGDDWQDFPGKEVLESKGIKIEYVPYTKGISSTKLRDELSKQ